MLRSGDLAARVEGAGRRFAPVLVRPDYPRRFQAALARIPLLSKIPTPRVSLPRFFRR